MDGQNRFLLFPDPLPQRWKINRVPWLVSTDRFFPTYTAFRDAFFFRDLGSAEIGTRWPKEPTFRGSNYRFLTSNNQRYRWKVSRITRICIGNKRWIFDDLSTRCWNCSSFASSNFQWKSWPLGEWKEFWKYSSRNGTASKERDWKKKKRLLSIRIPKIRDNTRYVVSRKVASHCSVARRISIGNNNRPVYGCSIGNAVFVVSFPWRKNTCLSLGWRNARILFICTSWNYFSLAAPLNISLKSREEN